MKVLVTGCAGFIGFHLSKNLLDRGISVVGVDSLNDYYDVNLKKDRLKVLEAYQSFKIYKLDIAHKEFNKKISSENFTSVIHLAAQAGVRYSIDHPEIYTQSNLVGFANILELCRVKNAKLVFASTSSVYGANTNLPFSVERIADHPIQYYAATKRANELMAHSYSAMYKIETIGLRFFTVYGPFGRPDMALFKFTKNIIEGKPIEVYNNGNHIRDFTYIDDIVKGIISALEYKFKNNSWNSSSPVPHLSEFPFRIFNLGNGKPETLMEYINIIEDYLEKKAIINFLPLQLGDVKETRADIIISSDELNFVPTVSIHDGIPNFIDWYKEYYLNLD